MRRREFITLLLEASNGRGREPAGVPAEQCDQRVLEVAARDALEVEDRDQHLQALRPARPSPGSVRVPDQKTPQSHGQVRAPTREERTLK